PIAGAVGPGNWYNLGAALSAATLLFSIPFVPESRYERSLQAYGQAQVPSGSKDEEEYRPTGKTDVWEGIYCVRNTFQILLFPNVLWAFCLNGLTIGTNVSIGTTFGTVMTSVYGWPDRSSSYVNAGQIVVAIVGLPILGYGSDKLITWKASRNNGVHEPESRLMLLGLPLSVGVAGAVIYGQAAEYPEKLHWFAIVAAIAMYYFAFVGGNIAAITYLLDSYPARAGPCLIVITAFRGFVSFGVSYGISDFIESHGYDGCFGTFGGLTAAFAILAIPICFFGKRIRRFTGKWSVKEKPTRPSMAR
ncbi:MFS general substrate transporter, partial [Hortaea werneckii]